MDVPTGCYGQAAAPLEVFTADWTVFGTWHASRVEFSLLGTKLFRVKHNSHAVSDDHESDFVRSGSYLATGRERASCMDEP